MNEKEEFEENKIKLKDNKISNLLTVKLVSKRLGFGAKRKAQVESQEIDIKLVNDATDLLLADLWKKLRMLPRKISLNVTTENT